MLVPLTGAEVILCQITSPARVDDYSVRLDASDFVSGGLSQSGRNRPNRLFTADAGIIVYCAGRVSEAKVAEVIERLIAILNTP